MSGVRRFASEVPVLNMRATDCVPTLGVLWQLAQVARCSATRKSSVKPGTRVTMKGLLLKICSPRAIDARARFCADGGLGGGGGTPRWAGAGGGGGASALRQAAYSVITLRLKGACVR